MSDIVERLRTHYRWPVEAHHDALEAADEIERLRKERNAAIRTSNNDAEQICRTNDSLIEANREIERLCKENFALAAFQCNHPYSDEYGEMHCAEIERLRKLLDARLNTEVMKVCEDDL